MQPIYPCLHMYPCMYIYVPSVAVLVQVRLKHFGINEQKALRTTATMKSNPPAKSWTKNVEFRLFGLESKL